MTRLPLFCLSTLVFYQFSLHRTLFFPLQLHGMNLEEIVIVVQNQKNEAMACPFWNCYPLYLVKTNKQTNPKLAIRI